MNEQFARYREELFWEIEQHEISLPELKFTERENVISLAFSGYQFLRFRVENTFFEARLS